MSSAIAPAAARASGPSVKAAYGSASATSATRAASWASPSSFGSTARSRPARIWSLREYSAQRPVASSCQPATRIGRIAAPVATPDSPDGPPAPTSRPAICVPWRSRCAGSSGLRAARAPGSPPTMSIPGLIRPRRYGVALSTPVSSSAIVTPRPSTPERPMSARWPWSGAKSGRASTSLEIEAG